MQFEVIKKSHKKEVVVGVVAIILIAVVLLVRNSFAKYQIIKSLKIAEGTINYKVPDFKIMRIYYQKLGQTCTEDSCYEEKESMPESGYTVNTIKSYCELNGSKDNNAEMYTDENGQHVIAKLTKGDRCYLYFDKELCSGSACKSILVGITPQESPKEGFTTIADTDEGVFKAEDDDGDTYYFRGAVTNNYVKFGKWSEDAPDVYIGYYSSTSTSSKKYSSLEACQSASSYNVNCTLISNAGKDMYWRIIRINGDGTIRMIYDGETARANGNTLTIDISKFNGYFNNNLYVGFQYKSGDVHGYGTEATNSTILDSLNSWYTTNLDKPEIKDKIDPNAGFCNDRDPYTDEKGTTPGGGTGKTTTYYGANIRLFSNRSTNATPTFKCKNSSDLFTKSGAIKKDGTANGNRALTNPIGLITADEVVYAGGYYATNNTNYYLYTGQDYYTLSPYNCINNSNVFVFAGVFIVGLKGNFNSGSVSDGYGVRPVINLRSDVTLTGSGTVSDPYVVE